MRRVWLGAVALCALVAGCVSPASVPTGAPTVAPSTSAEVDLRALRLQYGLPDCPPTDPAVEAVEGGMPQTQLQCLGSDVVVNLAGLERKPTVVNFWAQWCGPCREEAPYLREVSQARDDVAFIGINYNDPQADWAIEFAGLVGWVYPHIQDMDKELQTRMGVPGLPVTFYVDADGRIVDRHIGPFESTADLEAAIEENFGLS